MAQAFPAALKDYQKPFEIIGLERFIQTGAPSVEAFSRSLNDSGIVKSALHEIYAEAETDSAAAIGFILLAAQMSSTSKQNVLWVRQEQVQHERGAIYPPGLQHLGLAPETIIAVSAKDTLGVLQAGLEGAQCSSLNTVIVEFHGAARAYDITSSRRLSFAAKASGTRVFIMRSAADIVPSAAETRWKLRTAPSQALLANAPGHPRFELTLLRHKGGQEGRNWTVGWNHDSRTFN